MAIRLKAKTSVSGDPNATEWDDSSFDQRETTVNGYSFHWGVNQTRNFLDDGVGNAHAAFKAGPDLCITDAIPFGASRS